jgi:hypothetical protein
MVALVEDSAKALRRPMLRGIVLARPAIGEGNDRSGRGFARF